jgi:transmembrane 9 superfamily member 3
MLLSFMGIMFLFSLVWLPVLRRSSLLQIHGDVFRAPKNLALFSALLGTGVQLVTLIFLVVFLAMSGALYQTRGTIVTVFILCYAFTAVVSGFVSGRYACRDLLS